MNKIIVTYFITALLFISLLTPTIKSLYGSISGDLNHVMTFELIDSEKEENSEKGEKETKDCRENEKFEDEKLKNQHDKLSLLYMASAIRAKNAGHTNYYNNIVTAIPTPPPELL